MLWFLRRLCERFGACPPCECEDLKKQIEHLSKQIEHYEEVIRLLNERANYEATKRDEAFRQMSEQIEALTWEIERHKSNR